MEGKVFGLMNILYHHRTQGRGAEGNHIREIVKAFRKLGHYVSVVSPPGGDIFEINKVDRSEKNSILSILSKYLPQILFEIMEIAYNFTAIRNIKKQLQNSKIGLIYERYAFFCWAGVKLAQKNNIPFIIEVNEISGIQRVRGQVLISLAGKIEKKVLKSATKIIVVSEYLKKEIIARGVEENKILVLPNAVDTKLFNASISGARVKEKYRLTGKLVIGFVGNFSWWDRLEELISVFSELSRVDENLRLLLVGDGVPRVELERLTRDKVLEDRISFTGLITRIEVPEYIAAMDICVLADSNDFGSPMVLFEYLAMGKPVVAADRGPIKDILGKIRTGIMFKHGEQEDLKIKLSEAIKNIKVLQIEGKTAAAMVNSWEANARLILKNMRGAE